MAIVHVRPERFITLTLVGDEWQTIRGRMYRLRHDLAQEVGGVEWVWTVERNPAGTGHHVHAWQRGRFIPQRRLSALFSRRGLGARVDIRRWESGGEGYGLKEAYAVKDAAEAGYYLAMNGKRLTHHSRGFFPDGVKDCEKAALAARFGCEPSPWQLVETSWDHNPHTNRLKAPR